MKTFLKTVGWLVLFFAVALGLLYGLRNFNREPSVLFTNTTCEPPCWAGIQPGITTYQQIYARLNLVEQIDQTSIAENYNRDGSNESIFWYFSRPAEDSAGSIYLLNNQVSAISILTVGSLTLTGIIEKLGAPDQYWSEIGVGENREYTDIFLLYPEKGYCIELVIDLRDSSGSVTVKEKTPVYRVTYFDPKLYQDLLKTKLLITTPTKDRKGSFQAWTGFGTITIPQ